MNRWCRNSGALLQESSLLVVLFLVPFSNAAVEIGFGLLLLGWVLEQVDPGERSRSVWRQPRLRLLAVAIGAFLAACGLSILISDFPAKSLQGFFGKWLEYLAFFVIAADLGGRPLLIKRVMPVLAWSSVFVVFEGMTQELFGQGVFRGHLLKIYWRMTGPYTNPIDLAIYLMVLIPILLAWSATLRMAGRVAVGGLIVALGLCLARTETLGAWLGLIAGLLLLSLSGTRALRRSVFWLVLVVCLVGGAFLYAEGKLGNLTSSQDIGKVDRWAMWQAAIGMIRDRPLFGHGLNTFMANYLTYWVGGQQQPRYAHNCYLQMAAEIGLVGLAFFLALLGQLFWRYFCGLRQARSHETLILAGFCGGLAAFVLHASLDTHFYSVRQSALFWLLAGLALGLSERIISQAMPSARAASSHRAIDTTHPAGRV